MVDGVELFTHESSVSQSASSLYRLQILQEFDWVLRSWRVLSVSKNVIPDKAVFMSHAWSLFFLLSPSWQRNKMVDKLDTFSEIKGLLKGTTKDESENVCTCFSLFLDRMELTKLDTRAKFDRTIIQKSNKHHGLS